jgi:RHS repeat-associated protein
MNSQKFNSRTSRRYGALALLSLFLSSSISPVLSLPVAKSVDPVVAAAKIPPPPGPVHGVKTGPKSVKLYPPKLTFSANPTDVEITSSRFFAEPLIPADANPVSGENKALCDALVAFRAHSSSSINNPLVEFVSAYPKSRWTPAVQSTLGDLQFTSGYLSSAIDSWTAAWNAAKDTSKKRQSAPASHAMANLLSVYARLGRMRELKTYFAEVDSLAFFGSDEQKIVSAHQSLRAMQSQPEISFKCGPFALNSLLIAKTGKNELNPILKKAHSTNAGTNLNDLEGLAKSVGLNYRAARRTPGAAVIAPSVMHWKLDHFAALVAARDNGYSLKDPTFGLQGGMTISSDALDKETDGYFLVPADVALPTGWSYASTEEASSVWGKGVPNQCDPQHTGDYNWHPCLIPALNCNSCGGMTQPSAQGLQATLNLFDTPLSYTPPIGPKMDFKLNYIHQQADQPGTFGFTNIGYDWNLNWVSYLTVLANPPPGGGADLETVTLRMMGGGTEIYTSNGSSYNIDPMSRAQIVKVSSTQYNRVMPDGSVQIYNTGDTLAGLFMTQAIDPQGNSVYIQYDANFRITTITDSIGQVSTLTYLSNTIGNAGFYKVFQITDPFGRSCSFGYDSTTTALTSITDVINLKSSFTYDTSSSFINSLATPYGNSSFYNYVPGSAGGYPAQGLRFTFADGSNAAIESWVGEEAKPTYFWDRHAMQLYPNEPGSGNQANYTHCMTTEWTYDAANVWSAPMPQKVTYALEKSSPIYYTYPGQYGPDYIGISSTPSSVSRTLGNPIVVGTISGTVTPGDYLQFGVPGQYTFYYLVVAGDTPNSIAANIANFVNSSTNFQSLGVTAYAAGNTFSAHSDNVLATTYLFLPYTGATETCTLLSPAEQNANITIGGTLTVGDVVTVSVATPQPYHGSENFTHTVTGTDTLTSIASDLVSKINADAILAKFNCSASNVQAAGASPVINMISFNPDPQAYYTSVSGSGTETAILSELRNGSLQLDTKQYNSLYNVTQSIDKAGRKFNYAYDANGIDVLQKLETKGADNYQLGAWTYNSAHMPLTSTDGSGQVTHITYNSSQQPVTIVDANSNTTTLTYTGTSTASIGGTVSDNHIESIIVNDAGLSGGTKTVSYTEHTADTLTTIASGLTAAINADTSLQAIGVKATSSGSVITLKSTSVNVTTYSSSVTGSITITLGANTYGYLTKIDGPLAGSQDITTFTYDGYGRLYTQTDSEGYTLTFSYDNMNRLIKDTYPDGTNETIAYDKLDAVLITDRDGRCTQRSYDVLQQLVFEMDPLGRKTSFTWCSCGAPVTLTDPAGNITRWQHDLQGRTTQKIYQDSKTVTSTYDLFTGRLASTTDALSQHKDFLYFQDDNSYLTGYTNAINPTSNVRNFWDSHFDRIISAENGWGKTSYSYNAYIVPAGTPTTGGGRLSLVRNDVIANSDTTYTYDVLGRTTNRSINGASNSDTWSYDAMSRVTGESNVLGSFAYAYVDDVSGSSKGTARLSSVTYPNGQVTKYSWYPTIGDERLQQISNFNSSGATISQYGHVFDPAGQITQWQQLQGKNSTSYSLGYDQAGQLTTSQGSGGNPSPSYLKQNYYAYDLASNRIGNQSSSVTRVGIGGTVTTGNTITLTVTNSALTGGSEAVTYTVVAGDTLSSIAANLASAVTRDSALQAAGINAAANGSVLSVKSVSPNVTSYAGSTSGGATETVTVDFTANFVESVVIGGTKTTGNIVTVNVIDPALTGGKVAITYTVLSGDTLASIATGLKNAINANSSLTSLGVSATVAGQVVTIRSASGNATTYTQSTSTGATETLTLSVNKNGNQTAAITGTKTTSDVLTLTVYDAGLSGGKTAITYTVAAGDTLSTIASGLAANVTANTTLQAIGVSATSSSGLVIMQSNSINQTTYRATTSASATEKIALNVPVNGIQTAIIGGTKTTGNVLTVTVYDAGLSTGSEAVNYTVVAADTLTSIATNLAAAVTADANLSAIGVSATANNTVVNIKSTSTSLTTYSTSVSGGSTETIVLAPSTGATQYAYNNVNELTGVSSGGPTYFQGQANKALKSATVNSANANFVWSDSFFGTSSLVSGANSVSVSTTDGGSNLKTNVHQISTLGPASATVTYDANGNMTSDGTNAYSWDAENRLIRVTYPGTGNYSDFSYDWLDGLVKIVETDTNSVTSTKQFVRSTLAMCEERNGASAVTKQFFERGQSVGGQNYFYTSDHLGSVRSLVDSSGTIQALYEYGPWGESKQSDTTLESDFKYAGYYSHNRSQLSLTDTRAYSANLGRFINRDPDEEDGGTNLYSYGDNNPITNVDPSGCGGGALVKFGACAVLLILCIKYRSDAACRLIQSFCLGKKGLCKPGKRGGGGPSTGGGPGGGGGPSGVPSNGGIPTKYWERPHPEWQTPYSTHRRYHPNGDIKSVQTYDKFGNRQTRFDLKDSLGREEHRHNFEYGPGKSNGQESGHLPLEQTP